MQLWLHLRDLRMYRPLDHTWVSWFLFSIKCNHKVYNTCDDILPRLRLATVSTQTKLTSCAFFAGMAFVRVSNTYALRCATFGAFQARLLQQPPYPQVTYSKLPLVSKVQARYLVRMVWHIQVGVQLFVNVDILWSLVH